jgi:hypothetical protein
MNGTRFVHDRLELAGWQVEIADAQKVKGLAPLACKTDRIDAWVLAGSEHRAPKRRAPGEASARWFASREVIDGVGGVGEELRIALLQVGGSTGA